ncbi:MAG: carbohydrate kinase family protein [Eubacterium sp.]|jgi:sugar/nucleoside kinase (ribokinase family)|nr:carbohydrate kinase family protein [Eubacterium sp.]
MGFAAGVGFANFDMLFSGIGEIPREGEEVYARNFEIQLGGGVPATMINLSRLGEDARIITFLGRDFFSRFVDAELKKYKVRYSNVYEGSKVPVVVTTAMITKRDRTFMSYRAPIELSQEQTEKIVQCLQGAAVVDMHLGFLEIYRKIQKSGGTRFVFDTGWSDDLTIENTKEYLELADFYTPNQKEALKITGTDSLEKAADALSEFFPEIIIKLDREGCYYRNNQTGRKLIIPPISNIRAVDSTGAGDAFLSGFLYGLLHGYDTPDCIRFGNVTGGACVQGIGCLSSYVGKKELLDQAAGITPRII